MISVGGFCDLVVIVVSEGSISSVHEGVIILDWILLRDVIDFVIDDDDCVTNDRDVEEESDIVVFNVDVSEGFNTGAINVTDDSNGEVINCLETSNISDSELSDVVSDVEECPVDEKEVVNGFNVDVDDFVEDVSVEVFNVDLSVVVEGSDFVVREVVKGSSIFVVNVVEYSDVDVSDVV